MTLKLVARRFSYYHGNKSLQYSVRTSAVFEYFTCTQFYRHPHSSSEWDLYIDIEKIKLKKHHIHSTQNLKMNCLFHPRKIFKYWLHHTTKHNIEDYPRNLDIIIKMYQVFINIGNGGGGGKISFLILACYQL